MSGEIICDDDIPPYIDDSYSKSANGVESLDLYTSCNKFFTHSCVKGPCTSPRICLINFCDDMLTSHCGHDQNDYVSSSCCMINHVEEIKRRLVHVIKEEIARSEKKETIK